MRIIYEGIRRHWSEVHNRKARYRSVKSRPFFRRRDQAIVTVQVSAGLRPGETFALMVQDYDREKRRIFVDKGKTRYVPVTDGLAKVLDEWLDSRPVNALTCYLFVSDRGTQLHLDSWGHQFQRYVEFCRSEGHALPRITLYSLRHIAGTALAMGSDKPGGAPKVDAVYLHPQGGPAHFGGVAFLFRLESVEAPKVLAVQTLGAAAVAGCRSG